MKIGDKFDWKPATKFKSSKVVSRKGNYRSRSKKEFIEYLSDQEFDVLLTLPLAPHLHHKSQIDLSGIISRLLVNIQRKLFTRKEIKQLDYSLKVLPVIEDHKHCHFEIKVPNCCKRLPQSDLKYLKFRSMLEKEINRMKLFDVYYFTYIKPIYKPFYKKVRCPKDVKRITKYALKGDFTANLDTIDILNVNLAT